MVAFVSDAPNVKMSVNEFNANAEVKELSRIVHSYLNENLAPGTGLLGIKETDKEMIVERIPSVVRLPMFCLLYTSPSPRDS